MINVADPRGGTKLLRRSIKHLYPNEISSNDVSSASPPEDQEDVSESASSHSSGRPSCQAAWQGKKYVGTITTSGTNFPFCY